MLRLRQWLQAHTLWCAGLALLLCAVLVLGLEALDRRLTAQALEQDMAHELAPRRERLQATLDQIVAINRGFAREVAQLQHPSPDALAPRAAAVIAQQPRVASVLLTRRLKAVFVHPLKGNEAVIGIDYALHPEFMDSFKRAMASNDTAIDGPIRLLQTGRPGMVVRSPVPENPARQGEALQGVVSMAVDLEGLLTEAGVWPPSPAFAMAIRQVQGDRAGRLVFGEPEVFQRPHARARIALPDIDWELAFAPATGQTASGRSDWIRGVGVVLALALVLGCLQVGGQLPLVRSPGHPASPAAAERLLGGRQWPLRTWLLGTVVVTVPLVSGVSGWLSFQASMQVTEELERRHVVELADQLQERVTAFFDVPRRVAAFNVEQFRSGLLDPRRQEDILRNFLLQLRQQPLLTFVSMGTADGEYLAASRPPLGTDKALRMLQASQADGFMMKLYRVDDANRRSTEVSKGNTHFKANERPWFHMAVAAGSLGWYPAYRYNIQDEEGLFDTLGMGMSAPLYDAAGRFVGVATADVALSQLNAFMKEQVAGMGGVAFLTEASGALLASSGPEPIYRLEGETTQRLQATDSDNPRIRAAGRLIREGRSPQGLGHTQVDEERLLVHWQTVHLPNGPALTVGFALSESRFAQTATDVVRNVGMLSLVFVTLGILLSWLAANWLAHPLSELSQWAQQMATGRHASTPQLSSPIQEIASLTQTVNDMASQLQRHSDDLEQQVTERTAALEAANKQLATLSETDGLTGIANRRRFDEFANTEWSRATRQGHELALLMVDVDLFKKYNDRYGHQAGDEALKRVAAVLRDVARRPGDLAGRYGGEEFAIVAAHTAEDAAMDMAQGVRAAIEALAIPHGDSPMGVVTASVGVAVLDPTNRCSLQQLIKQADEALYRAKNAGRNRVEGRQPR